MEDNLDNRPDAVVDRTRDKRCTKEVSKSDILAMKKTDSVLSYCCIEDYMKNFPQEEMEEVLRKLRERNVGPKGLGNVNCLCDNKKEANKSLSHLIDKLKISSNLLEQNKELKKSNIFYNKNSDYCDSKMLFKQALRLNKESSNKKTDQNFKTMTPQISSQPDVHHKVQFGNDAQNLHHPKDQPPNHHILANKLNLLQSSNYFLQTKNDSHLFHVPDHQKSPELQNRSDPNRTLSPTTIPPRYGSVNIKKCGAFLMKSDSGELSGDERDISESAFSPADTFDDDDVSSCSYSNFIHMYVVSVSFFYLNYFLTMISWIKALKNLLYYKKR